MASYDPQRPNVVCILTDDQGYWALGAAGNDEIRTPHLDRLAAEGRRFDSFFCTSPVCSPARASLLTGRIPSQHGVHDFLHEPPAGTAGLDHLRGHETYVDVLARDGYECGFVGKWHLGQSLYPRNGFTHWWAHPSGAGPYFGAQMVRDGRVERVGPYLTDALTDEAIAYMRGRERSDRPFYLSLHYTAPHAPWEDAHPRDLVDLYADCAFDSIPREPRHPWMKHFADVMRKAERNPRRNLQGYFAAVTGMDAGVGRILHHLEHEGLAESTLVVFLSDNGFNAGHHGIWGKGNGTFPMNMYDTSVKVPCIFWQPGRIPGGEVDTRLRSAYDLFPTLLGYLGVGDLPAFELPGVDWSQELSSAVGADGPEYVVVYAEYGPARMIRTTRWKFVERLPYGPDELFDLVDDPDERVNLANDAGYRSVRQELRLGLRDWFRRHVDPERDGASQPVTGAGQIGYVDRRGAGADAFEPHPEADLSW